MISTTPQHACLSTASCLSKPTAIHQFTYTKSFYWICSFTISLFPPSHDKQVRSELVDLAGVEHYIEKSDVKSRIVESRIVESRIVKSRIARSRIVKSRNGDSRNGGKSE